MQSLFDKLGKAATSAATNAASKAEEMREINKLKSERNELKSEYTVTKKKLAEYVFKQYQDGELTDSALVEFCDRCRNSETKSTNWVTKSMPFGQSMRKRLPTELKRD